MLATNVKREAKPAVQKHDKDAPADGDCPPWVDDLRSNVERQARAWRNLGDSPAEPAQGMQAWRPVISPGDGWTVVLRRQPARMVEGRPEGGYTNAFELSCWDCSDHPGLDYCEASPELQRVRRPYPIAAGIAAHEKHLRRHRQPASAARGAMTDAG